MVFEPTEGYDPISWTGEVGEEGTSSAADFGSGPGPLDNGRHERDARLPDAGVAARRDAGRAGADGGHHQRRLPPALRRAGCRSLRLRDDHQPRARRGRRDHPEDAGLRRARVGALGAALRQRPGLHRQGRRDPVRRPRRRPRRPQLRLPGAQGDPQGRRGSAAVEARPARRDPHRRGHRCGAVRRPGDDEDPQGPRRRPPHLPRRRPDRPGDRGRGDRAARAHRPAGLLRRGRLGRDRRPRRPRRHPGPRQRRHLGGRGRAPHGRADRCRRSGRRPRLPGPSVALPRPGRRLPR